MCIRDRPDILRDLSVSRDSFCRQLKTHLFTLYWSTQRIRDFMRMCYTNLLLTYLKLNQVYASGSRHNTSNWHHCWLSICYVSLDVYFFLTGVQPSFKCLLAFLFCTDLRNAYCNIIALNMHDDDGNRFSCWSRAVMTSMRKNRELCCITVTGSFVSL